MNRGQLRSELAFFMNVKDGEVGQDFTTARLNKALDRAYNLVLEDAKLHGGKDYFRSVSADVSWTASAQRLTLPSAVDSVLIESVYDITSGQEPGAPFLIGSDATQACAAFWYDKNTLQWAADGGPNTAITLRFYYEAVAEELQDDEAEPEYIPPQFHWLIVVRAAVLLKGIADETIPRAWRDELMALELGFVKHLTRGRPLTNYPRINRAGQSGAYALNNVDTSAPGSPGLDPP